MCVASWSLMGFVKKCDIMAAVSCPEVEGEEEELGYGWDTIITSS